jgi:hypothetical protein
MFIMVEYKFLISKDVEVKSLHEGVWENGCLGRSMISWPWH